VTARSTPAEAAWRERARAAGSPKAAAPSSGSVGATRAARPPAGGRPDRATAADPRRRPRERQGDAVARGPGARRGPAAADRGSPAARGVGQRSGTDGSARSPDRPGAATRGRRGTPPAGGGAAARTVRQQTWQVVARRNARDVAIPDDVTADELDPAVRRELRGLAGVTSDLVARHLVAAGRLLDDDPQGALAQARAARALAGRIGSVREAAGIAAYRAGEYAEALADLRAARRLDGNSEHLPLMADSERGLGRPERALALGDDPGVGRLDHAARIELAIVLSGARRDLEQPEAAVLALQGADLDDATVHPWSVRLWYAYAEALLAAGRRGEARRWFARAAAEDGDDETDAEDRASALE